MSAAQILAEMDRRAADVRRRIAAGEMLLCSKERPMPADRDQMGQKWFHEDAKCESDLPDSPDGSKNRVYKCAACGLRYPVVLRRFTP